MSSFVQKATPFFEHILIGFGFAFVGYLFFWTFNTTFISILGMVAVCFGGLKILFGTVIYGYWIFNLAFRKGQGADKQERLVEGKKANDDGEPTSQPNWLQSKVPFVAKHWGTLLELSILFTGFVMILVAKNAL